MKKKLALILILTLLLALGAFAACGDPHEHDLQHFEAKDPTCEKEGNIEYWYCAGCGKYFADKAAGTEITKEKTVLAATGEHDWSEWVIDSGSSCTIGGMRHRVCSDCGERQEEALPIGEHDMTHVAAVGATCIDEGNVEYWHCNICGKNFADQNAEELLEEVVLPLGAHTLEYIEQVSSTCVEAGVMAHWHCKVCDKNYADQNAEELLEDVSLPRGTHNIVNGKCTVCGLDEIFITGTPGLQYTLNEDGTAYTASGMGTATDTNIVIASEYNGLPVTSIGDNAFFNCNSLTGIIIPDSVTSIDTGAFAGCDSLESIIVDEGNTVYHSDGNCLIKTDSKTLVAGCKNSVIPSDGSVTRIGDHAFARCSSLTSIVIPEGATSIGKYAFWYCSSLTSITFQGSMEQWIAIDKGTEWNLNAGSYTVTCTDGVLDKDDNKI